jgi:CRISPR-associated endonuclease/helicase Cas3
MTARASLTAADFDTFFHAVHGHDPFPWQSGLARRVAEGEWPKVLDLPTGSGKTAALDIAVFTLALSALAGVPKVPRRIVYVVDRRTIVDQAYERASRIRRCLLDSTDDVVVRVRQALAACSRGHVPLRVASLRGGVARDESWARTPDQPLIAVSTVDQVGSRLLFRGYGIADSMKPIHAGLLGNDVLYLLDEVHLSQPFKETLDAIASRYRSWALRPLETPFAVVEMSATPGEVGEDVFRLGDNDRRHVVLQRRLEASKPAELVSVPVRQFLKEVETRAAAMLARPGATVGIIVNRVRTARDIHAAVSTRLADDGAATFLLTGRMRPFDRDAVDGALIARISAGRDRQADESPVVVVATQTIEVGADFDFDGLVTECASLDALRQRFGRLDRLGVLNGTARGVIVARPDTLKGDPVYGEAVGQTWEWLAAQAADGCVGFGIEELTVPQDAEAQGLLAPRVHAPIMLPSHLDAWVQTSPIPAADPDITLWLHGPERGSADVQIIWRADLDASLLQHALDGPKGNDEASETVLGIVDALPPTTAEAMAVPFVAARRWLQGRDEADVFDVEGAPDVDEEAPNPRTDRPPRPALLWQRDQSKVIVANDLRPGQTIVVPASYGGIAHANWAPGSQVPVSDVAELAAWRSGRRAVLRLHPAITSALFGVAPPVPPPYDSEDVNDRDIVSDWLNERSSSGVAGALGELVARVLTDYRRARVARVSSGVESPPNYFVVSGPARAAESDADEDWSPDDDESTFTDRPITLSRHSTGVSELVADFATHVGLPDDCVSDLKLAGLWHDAGKADLRFQRWLHGGSEFKALVQREPLAKGTVKRGGRREVREARERAGYPKGARHEVMSLALMDVAAASLADTATDWARTQYIVATHHGHCRPLVPWVPDPHPVDVTFRQPGGTTAASSAHGLERLDSGVAERFWQMVRIYGWWGIAWLEAIFRLADHRRSEIDERSGGKIDD